MSETIDVEMVAMQVILAGGNARSEAYEALRLAKQGDFAGAGEHMVISRQELASAHKIQTDLIQKEAGGQPTPMCLLMVHAQDHLMTAMAESNLIQELIDLHKRLSERN